MKSLKWVVISFTVAALLAVIVSGSWILTESALQATSGEAFCSTCHSMTPFAETYAADVHGGNNPKGLAAACADCHLPHDSESGYLIAKMKTGLYDLWAETLTLFKEPDWLANLERRAQFVYDSGCASCHSRLAEAQGQTEAGQFAHRAYFEGGTMKCVTCHDRVGHAGLRDRLASGTASPDGDDAEAGNEETSQ
ncbi:cytochrome c3 family protein [Thiorhodococcus minor]|uniref:Cytochrome c-type protein n=1 Tax=Thiorhodococcus minor TaxID=57489 RepID=A0A6M0K3Y9_9GAMM|nr:NapC/NirT family cytochrome c [Thiorhodococcus minor]NEV63964.1 7-cyano-7-deazaguanine reductase [Thiorhodococcus minor]